MSKKDCGINIVKNKFYYIENNENIVMYQEKHCTTVISYPSLCLTVV